MDLISLLKKVPVFEGLSEDSFGVLAGQAEVKTFGPEEPIIRLGDEGKMFGIVLSGEVEAGREFPDGRRERFVRIPPHDYFGEMSLMTGEPTSAHVVALVPTEILLIPHAALSRVLVREPRLAATLAKTISKRMVKRERNLEEQERLKEAQRARSDPYGLSGFSVPGGGKVLTINCGSSSLKYRLFDSGDPEGGIRGWVERIGLPETRHTMRHGTEIREEILEGGGHGEAIEAMVKALGGEKGLGPIEVVGHRVVHGGEKHGHAVVVDEEVMEDIRACENLAPLHMPANIAGIESARRWMPGTPQVAVFDTGFHRTLPRHAFVYGLPYEYYASDGVRRYGFHGMSHKYVAYRAATHLKHPLNDLKLITCHLGNGASVTAIDHGRSIDTTMGLTPLEGLVMGTRPGDLDPGAVLHLMKIHGLSPEEMERVLNRESGLKGLSGVSSDMREVLDAAKKGNDRALLAVQAFCYKVKKYIGSYWAVLGGLDALVFTGGIGERSPEVRARITQGLAGIGIALDEEKNLHPPLGTGGGAADVSAEVSPVHVLVIPTDEERMIAREAARALQRRHVTEIMRHKEDPIPIGVSAHHVHLSKEHVETLFGDGHALTFKTRLTQPAQFACNEQVTLVGPKGRVERVRVLGPERKETQVEISRTEEFRLGIDAPIRLSGDLKGTPGIKIEGTCGKVTLDRGVICALRHIHMTPQDALGFGVQDRDVVMAKVVGERSLIFGDVVMRVKPDFKLELHLDTDEANAAEVNTGMRALLHAIQSRH